MKIGILENGEKSIYRKIISTCLIVCSLLCLVAIGFGQQPAISRRSEPDYRLHLRGYTFDPLKVKPDIPDKLRIAKVPTEPTYYIIQFTKSLTREERAQIQSKYGLRLTDYIPHFAFLEKLSPQTLDALSENPLFRAKVLYQPAFKISPDIGKIKFRTPKRKAMKGFLLRAMLFSDADPSIVVNTLKKANASKIKVIDDRKNGGLIRVHFILPSKNALPQIARLNEVRWIEEIPEIIEDNVRAAETIQSGTPGTTPIWNQGIHGENQIIGIIDSAPLDINHCFFEDSTNNTPRLDHRKVLDMRNASGSNAGGHATFVAGCAAGDDFNNPGAANRRGGSWASRLISGNYYDLNLTSVLAELSAASKMGATIHSNSWHDNTAGAGNPATYNQTSADVDTFTWYNEDNLVLGSAGNNGEEQGPPGTAKNAICVGASQADPNEMNFADGNSGPTADGRRKPDLMAPGCGIWSAMVNTACATGQRAQCATSYATPHTAAAAALIRQYYTEGWYPTGTQQPHHAFIPSGALLKATLLNSTVDMTGIAGYPNDLEGLGLIRLNRVLFFPGSARNLKVWDFRNADGLYTSQSRIYQVDVETNTQPLKVTLVWTEPPGTSGSNNPVVNNIDLSVTSPDGTKTFLGNYFVGGVSATGGNADALNNVEIVLINNPAPGDWTITVTGTQVNVGNLGQGYALVATADMSEPLLGLWYSFHLGVNFPLGSFSKNYDPGPCLTLDFEYRLRDNLSILGLLGFHYFHGEDKDLYWENLSINAKIYFPLSGWRWYINGGAGIYFPNTGANKTGINLGIGLNFLIDPRLSLDIGADYHLVDPGGNNRFFADLKMGIIFRF